MLVLLVGWLVLAGLLIYYDGWFLRPQDPVRMSFLFASSWMLALIAFFVGHFQSFKPNPKYRFGSILRFFGLSSLIFGGVLLSSSEVSRYVIGMFAGRNINATWLVFSFTILLTFINGVFTFSKRFSLYGDIEVWEQGFLGLPPIVLFIMGQIFWVSPDSTEGIWTGIYWLIFFNIYTVILLSYLYIRSQIDEEVWLRIVSIFGFICFITFSLVLNPQIDVVSVLILMIACLIYLITVSFAKSITNFLLPLYKRTQKQILNNLD